MDIPNVVVMQWVKVLELLKNDKELTKEKLWVIKTDTIKESTINTTLT